MTSWPTIHPPFAFFVFALLSFVLVSLKKISRRKFSRSKDKIRWQPAEKTFLNFITQISLVSNFMEAKMGLKGMKTLSTEYSVIFYTLDFFAYPVK